MNKVIIISLFFSLLPLTKSFSQKPGSNSLDSIEIEYKYPYFGPFIPPYIGVIGGVEGFQSHFWEAGIVVNYLSLYTLYPSGGYVGNTLLYKSHFKNKLQSIELECGIYSPISIGFNLNYTYTKTDHTMGIKPFVGISIFHFQFLWGYNFFSKTRNNITELKQSSFNIRYWVPLFARK